MKNLKLLLIFALRYLFGILLICFALLLVATAAAAADVDVDVDATIVTSSEQIMLSHTHPSFKSTACCFFLFSNHSVPRSVYHFRFLFKQISINSKEMTQSMLAPIPIPIPIPIQIQIPISILMQLVFTWKCLVYVVFEPDLDLLLSPPQKLVVDFVVVLRIAEPQNVARKS